MMAKAERDAVNEAGPGRPRVRFVINSLAGGGAERVFSTIVAGSQGEAAPLDFGVILLDREEEAYVLPDWVPVTRLDCGGSLLKSILGLRRIFRQERPDVTMSFLSRANAACVVNARLLGFQTVISERINTTAHLGKRLHGRISGAVVRATYPRADAVITIAQGIVEDLVRNFGVRRERISVIMNPIDGARIRQMGAQAPEIPLPEAFILAVGRLTRIKRFSDLIKAYAQANVPQSLVILGEGPDRADLEALVSSLGLEGRVLLPGFVRNPYAIMTRATFAASTSTGEGLPNALLELLALGVPAAHTNCASGPSEVLALTQRELVPEYLEAKYGILTQQERPEIMARALVALQNPELRARYAAAGPERVSELEIEPIKTKYWAVVDAVRADRRSS